LCRNLFSISNYNQLKFLKHTSKTTHQLNLFKEKMIDTSRNAQESLIAILKRKYNTYLLEHKEVMCYVFAIMSNIFFSLETFSVKKVQGLSVMQISYFRCLCFFVPNYFIAKFSGEEMLPKGKLANRLLIIRGLLSLLAQFFYYKGYMILPLAEAAVLFFTNPVITTVIASCLLSEKFEVKDLAACISCITGIILIIKPPFIFGSSDNEGQDSWEIKFLGASFMLIAASSRSLASIIIRKVSKQVSGLLVTLHYGATSSLFAPALIVNSGSMGTLTLQNTSTCIFLGIMGFLGQLFMAKALALTKASKVSIMGYMQIVFAYLLDIFINDNIPDWLSVVGTVLICVTLFTSLYQNLTSKQS